MPTSKTTPLSKNDIQKATEQYLSSCLDRDEQEFNQLLKGQLDDLIIQITDSLLPNTDPNWQDIRQSVKEHINTFWQRYKKREGPKQDLATKQLATDFRDYFSWLTCVDRGQETYPQTIRMPKTQIIVLNQIADAFLETKDLQGTDILIQIEFEAQYKTDKEMDLRMLHYESIIELDQQRIHTKNKHIPQRKLFMQVFYLRRSAKSGANKPRIEHIERTVTTPTLSLPKPVKYTAYHVYQFDIVDIIQTNLPFLFCFVGNMNKVTPEKIRQHQPAIKEVIDSKLTDSQRQTMKMILANFKQKGYYDMENFDNIDIIEQMIEVSEIYRGNEALFLQKGVQQGIQQGVQQGIQRGEEINSVKWFLRGQLPFSSLVEELGELRANRVQQNAENFKNAMENGTPLLSILEQLDKAENK